MSRIKGLKMTDGRIRMLTALCEPGAFAYPAGEIANEDGRRRVWRLHEEPALLFEVRGWISREKPPKSMRGYVFVWRITELGRSVAKGLHNET